MMKYTHSIYDKFLKILKISKRDPSISALTQLVQAHLTTIPFENISKIYYKNNFGLMTIPDFDMYIDGISRYNFGGTCYSNNYYLNKLLNYLGYNVRLCGADMTNPDVHIVNIVNIEDREFLIDLGYAAPFYAPIPLDLKEEYKIAFGADKYILIPKTKNGNYELKMFRNERVKHGYKVKPQARSISDFETVINNSFRESATFLNAVLLVRFNPMSSVTIHNFSLIESFKHDFKLARLDNKAELAEKIYFHFVIPKNIVEESLNFITKFEDAWS
jgi:arylamine N-acetyltransferase